jgi:hypothetical protein
MAVREGAARRFGDGNSAISVPNEDWPGLR